MTRQEGQPPKYLWVNRLLGNVSAFLIGTILIVFLLEGATRLLSNVLGVSPYMQYDAELGWTATPNAVKHHKDKHAGFEVKYKINDQGFRGQSYSASKPPGIRRILVLGDSNGFGWGIPEGEQMAALLDAEIAGVEVINLSLGGYGTDQSYLRFVREGLSLQPDLVILQVTHNDFEEIQHPFFNQKPKPHFVFDGNGNLELVNVPVRMRGANAMEFNSRSIPLPFREWLGWNSYAYNLLNEKYYTLSRKFRPRSTPPPPPVFSAESLRLFNAIVMQFAARLNEIGAKGLIVHASKDVHKYDSGILKTLPVVDVYPEFEKAVTSGLKPLYRDGYHWTPLGNRLVADRLIKVLEEDLLLGMDRKAVAADQQ